MPYDAASEIRFKLSDLRKSLDQYTRKAILVRLDLEETVRATRKIVSETRALLSEAERLARESSSLNRWFSRPSTMEAAVAQHRFKIGQTVNYTSGPFGRGAAGNVYKITRLLPLEGDDFQYRIKSSDEPHERVVTESQLRRAA